MIKICNWVTGKLMLTLQVDTLARENLSGMLLTDADLRGQDMTGTDMTGTILRGADLTDAKLTDADLTEADLRWADMRRADLRWADMRRADLTDAKLTDADLTEADLRWADLTKADLRGARLWNTIGNGKQIKNILLPDDNRYRIAYTRHAIQIGCQNHTAEEWGAMTDRDLLEMDGRKAADWYRKHMQTVLDIVASDPAEE